MTTNKTYKIITIKNKKTHKQIKYILKKTIKNNNNIYIYIYIYKQ